MGDGKYLRYEFGQGKKVTIHNNGVFDLTENENGALHGTY